MRDYLQAQSDTDTQPCVLVCDIPTPLVLSAGLLPLLLPVQALAQTCLVFVCQRQVRSTFNIAAATPYASPCYPTCAYQGLSSVSPPHRPPNASCLPVKLRIAPDEDHMRAVCRRSKNKHRSHHNIGQSPANQLWNNHQPEGQLYSGGRAGY